MRRSSSVWRGASRSSSATEEPLRDDHDEGRYRGTYLREGRLLEEGGDGGGGVDLRAGEAPPRARREGQDLRLRQLRREREAPAQGPQPADRRGDRHLGPPRAHLQGEPGAQEDDEWRCRLRTGP